MYYALAQHRILETERLILRPITLEDAEDMYEYASDAENVDRVFPRHQSLEETRFLIAILFMKNPLGHYAIEERASGKMIGTCDIRPDEANESVELAYALNKKYWGQGIATEAATELMRIAKEALKAKRIWAMHDITNLGSGRVMEKIGMEKEGIIRNYKNLCGEMSDQAIYSLVLRE